MISSKLHTKICKMFSLEDECRQVKKGKVNGYLKWGLMRRTCSIKYTRYSHRRTCGTDTRDEEETSVQGCGKQGHWYRDKKECMEK